MDKATRAQVKRHNRRIVMRALFEELADNRAALAVETGLTKPTIGTIIGELIDNGYVREDGFGTSGSSGGKRPTILRFLPDARRVIGVSIQAEEIIAGLAMLDGTSTAHHHSEILPGCDLLKLLDATINALLVQSDAPVMAIAIGIPGLVDDEGLVLQSSMEELNNVALASTIQERFAIPCYVSNNTALITRMQVKESQKNGKYTPLVTVSVGDVIEIGSSYGGNIYQHGGDIRQFPIPDSESRFEVMQWQQVKQRMATIAEQNPDSVLNSRRLSYLLLRRAIFLEETEALELHDNLATLLSHIYIWVIALMRPSEIVLTGAMSLLGQSLLDAISAILREQLPGQTVSRVRLTVAQSEYLSMQGAVVFALQEELGIV